MSISVCVLHPQGAILRTRIASKSLDWSVGSGAITSSITTWFGFALQFLTVVALQFGDDIFRGNINPPNVAEAMRHAQQVASIEQAHGIFVEPALQIWARQVHAPFGMPLFSTITAVTNVIYALGQTLIPLVFAIWLYQRHRSHFPLVRNIIGLTIVLAVIGYELYPLAPPRLATGLIYGGHAFSFQNTMQGVIGNGKLSSVPLGYNAYSAMPSLHIATALIVSGCVLLLARGLTLRLLVVGYPFIMLFTVLVDANHYLLDAVGGALVVMLATVIALALQPGHAQLSRISVAPRSGIRITRLILSTGRARFAHALPSIQRGIVTDSSLTAARDSSMVRMTLCHLRSGLLQRRDRTEIVKREAELDPDGIAVSSSEWDQAVPIKVPAPSRTMPPRSGARMKEALNSS